MEYTIEILDTLSTSDYQCINSLMTELSPGKNKIVSFDTVSRTLKNSHIIVARDNKKIIAMLTVAFYDSLNGLKSWIEDVIVSDSYRRQGISKLLLEKAIFLSKDKGASSMNLTSRPSRLAAHELYKSFGFAERDTDVFVLTL